MGERWDGEQWTQPLAAPLKRLREAQTGTVVAMFNLPIPKRISTRIGLVVAAVAAACAVIMGIALTRSLNEVLVDQQARELELTAAMQQQAFSQVLAGTDDYLRFLAGLRSTRRIVRALRNGGVDPQDRVTLEGAAKLMENSYGEMMKTQPDFLAVHLLSVERGGREVVRLHRTSAGVLRVPPAGLQRKVSLPSFEPFGAAGRATVFETVERGTAPRPGGEGLAPVVTCWIPLYDAGTLAAAIAIDVDLHAVFARVARLVPADWIYAIADQQGRVYLATPGFPGSARAGGEPLRLTRVYPQIAGIYAGGGEGVVQASSPWLRSRGDLLAVRRVPLQPASQGRAITMLLSAKYRLTVAPADWVHIQAIVLAIGAILAAAAVTILAARHYLQPLRQIVDGVRHFVAGEPDPELPVGSRDELGVVARALQGMIRDVSQQTRALQDSEQRYRNILATAQEGIWMLDAQGQTTWCNQHLASMLATTQEALHRASLYAFVHPDWEPAARSAIGRARAYGPERFECRMVTRAGGDLWCELSAASLPGGQAGEAGVLVMVWDLTARRQAEQELDRVARMRELILSAAGDGIFGLDSDLRFTFVNPAAAAMLGHPAQALLGRPLHAIHPAPAEGAEPRECPLCARAGSGRDSHGIETLRHGDGHAFPAEYVCTPLAPRPRSGAVVVFKDVTERERLQRMKEEFVSTVGHELRTPMTSVLGSLRLVLGRTAGEIPAEMHELLTIALNNGERLVRIVNDILDIERFESGQMALALAPVQALQVLQTSLEVMRPLAQQARVSLELDPVPPEYWVRADADRLVQVVTNFISNAVKFSPQGGTVRVSARQEGPSVRVLVADQGPGIPAEFRSRVFQKFAQADSERRNAKGGTGLGLSICKAILERHGGQVGFESSPGHGATFYFDLARLAETPEGAVPKRPDAEPGTGQPDARAEGMPE